MSVAVDPGAAVEKSRLVLISFTSLSMRLMENWRELINDVSGQMPDYEKTMILGAIITIGGEKLMREELEPSFQNLSDTLPSGRLAKSNVASVAAAVGLNSETVRRKVKELIQSRLVIKDSKAGLQISPGLLQLPAVREALSEQLALLRRTAQQLIKLDVLQIRKP